MKKDPNQQAKGEGAGGALEKLRAANAELETELEMRTADLAAAHQQLEEMFSSLSNELRAPLRAINGFSQILMQDHGAGLSKQLQDYLKMIQGEASRAVALIEDLLAAEEQNPKSSGPSPRK